MESEWINVSDKLPDLYDFVLVVADNKGTGEPKPISIARWEGKKWEFINHSGLDDCYGVYMDIGYAICDEDITHWMTLPKPPNH